MILSYYDCMFSYRMIAVYVSYYFEFLYTSQLLHLFICIKVGGDISFFSLNFVTDCCIDAELLL